MYTDEMRALNNAYASEYGIDNEAAYVFVMQGSTGSTGVLLGDMPIKSQFGYIFSPEGVEITAKTIAHEIAHGMFQLKHTFDEDYGIDKASTNNLMDYTDGTILFKQQWDAMYDEQALLFAWLQDEEEGMFHIVEDLIDFIYHVFDVAPSQHAKSYYEHILNRRNGGNDELFDDYYLILL